MASDPKCISAEAHLYFPIVDAYKLTENANVAMLLCQNELMPAYCQLQMLLEMISAKSLSVQAKANCTKAVCQATITLDASVNRIEPFVDKRIKVNFKKKSLPKSNNDLQTELCLITMAHISVNMVELILDTLIEINQNINNHHRLYEYLPKEFNTQLKLILNEYLDFLIAFLNNKQIQIDPLIHKINDMDKEKLYSQIRKLILLLPAQMNAFSWSGENINIYYFNALDFALTVSYDVINMLIENLIHLFVNDLMKPCMDAQTKIWLHYKKELKAQVTTLMRYFRLKITYKMHRPLGYISSTIFKKELLHYKDYVAHTNPSDAFKDFVLTVEYKEEMKSHSQSIIFRVLRKFILNLVLNKHAKCEHIRFQNDLLGMLNSGRDIADLIVTLLFSKEDISHLFHWSRVLLIKACKTIQSTDSISDHSNREQYDAFKRIYAKYADQIADANFHEPPEFLVSPYPWEKLYSLPPDIYLPGFDHKISKNWFVNAFKDLFK